MPMVDPFPPAARPTDVELLDIHCSLGVSRYENFGDVIFGDVSNLFHGRCEMCDVIFGDVLLNFKKV